MYIIYILIGTQPFSYSKQMCLRSICSLWYKIITETYHSPKLMGIAFFAEDYMHKTYAGPSHFHLLSILSPQF